MTEQISTKLMSVLDGIIDIAQDQHGTPDLPYAVYQLDVAPSYVKGKIYKLSGTLTIRIYTSSDAQGKGFVQSVQTAIDASMQNNEFRTRMTSATSYDDNGKYLQTLEYSVAQLSTTSQTE